MAAENVLEFDHCLDTETISAFYNKLYDLDFTNISENDEKQTQNEYESIGLFKTSNQSQLQKSLWKLLTVGRKYNCPQILLLLFSDYSRQRINHFIQTHNSLSIYDWQKISKPLQIILSSPKNSKIYRNVQQIISSSIHLFQRRLCSPITFDILPQEKINDSFLFFAKHILNGVQLIKNKNFKSQSQLDIWIIPDKIGEEHTIINDIIDDDDFDDESSDSDSDSDDEMELPIHINSFNSSTIDEHIKATIDEKNYVFGNDFLRLKGRFMNKIVNNYNRQKDIKRYCMIVKKGKKILNEEKMEKVEEEIYMYIPKDEYKIPGDICEWGINATLSDILPGKQDKFEKITGKQSLNGKMFVLSLQKDQENEVRAWLYFSGSISRFYTSDILNILPYLFVNNEMNTITRNQYNQLKNRIRRCVIPDEIFDKCTDYKHNKNKLCKYGLLFRDSDVIKEQKIKPISVSVSEILNDSDYSEQGSENTKGGNSV